jgi:predicted glycosyltransferase
MAGGAMTFPVAAPKSALVCALDWGLGHVARTTPLVRSLLACGSKVTLASNGRSAAWWRNEFPQLETRELPDYGVTYRNGWRLVPGLLASLPRIAKAMRQESSLVGKWHAVDGFDLVLSDNRYGCRVEGVDSVLLTHQLRLAAPKGFEWCESLGEYAISRLTRKFDEIWVPDHFEVNRLSGKLGHPARTRLFPKIRHIGPLSRFDASLPVAAWAEAWDTVALVSGPEPARTVFEEALGQILSQRPGRHLLVRGRPDLPMPATQLAESGLTVVPHLATPELALALKGAQEIICRGGYSTIMDLSALGILDRRCLFVPTPGQTEQEYLARHLSETGFGRWMTESDLATNPSPR